VAWNPNLPGATAQGDNQYAPVPPTEGGGAATPDTGWRDITALFAAAGWTGYGYAHVHQIKIKRTGSLVFLAGTSFANIPDNPGYAEIAMPAGFAPTVSGVVLPWKHPTEGTLNWTVTTATLRVSGYDGDVVRGECFWSTDSAWPTSLPGSAL
jgi:hypothetical protein